MWPRSSRGGGWLAAPTVEQGLFLDSSAEPPPLLGRAHPCGPWPVKPLSHPRALGPGPSGCTHTDPHSTPFSTHTLSRLWAWVRGDSSCSTRRSWGAARESIAATPQTLPAPWDPRPGQADTGPAFPRDLGVVLPRSPVLAPVLGTRELRPREGTWPTQGAADPGGRGSHPRCLCGPALSRAASQPLPAPLCTRTRGGAPCRDRPARTVAGKRSPGNWAAGGATGKLPWRAGPSTRARVTRRGEDRELRCWTRGLNPGVGTSEVERGTRRPGPTGGLQEWESRCLWLLRPAPHRCGAASAR